MFTDLNIFGIHEMHIRDFKFRKNLPVMNLFRKFEPKIKNGLMKDGWNLI